jgi:hypothetical protein
VAWWVQCNSCCPGALMSWCRGICATQRHSAWQDLTLYMNTRKKKMPPCSSAHAASAVWLLKPNCSVWPSNQWPGGRGRCRSRNLLAMLP